MIRRTYPSSLFVITLLLTLSGCSGPNLMVDTVKANWGIPVGKEIQSYAVAVQPLSKALLASPGLLLLRVNKSSDLPNAFGKADIYGGKVDRGFTEVRLASVQSNSVFTLAIADLEKGSAETTMERYKDSMPVQQADNSINIRTNVTTNVNLGTEQSNVPVTAVKIDFSTTKFIAVGSHIIHFDGFDGTNLTYRIEKQ
jgi:hypothetical protein